MSPVVVLAGSELPTELMGRERLKRRAYLREESPEYRFHLDDPWPRIPIRRHGTIEVVHWGNVAGRSEALPRTGMTRKARVESGDWSRYHAVPVEIAATFWGHNGAWAFIREGIRGVLVPDESGWAVCYVVCEPATNYYTNMTRSRWSPVLVNQVI